MEAGGTFLGDCHPYFLLDIFNYFVVQLSWCWLWTLDWKCEMLQNLKTFWGAKQCHKWRGWHSHVTSNRQRTWDKDTFRLHVTQEWVSCWTVLNSCFYPQDTSLCACEFQNLKNTRNPNTASPNVSSRWSVPCVTSVVSGSQEVACLWSSSGEWRLASRQCCIYFHSWECHIFYSWEHTESEARRTWWLVFKIRWDN